MALPKEGETIEMFEPKSKTWLPIKIKKIEGNKLSLANKDDPAKDIVKNWPDKETLRKKPTTYEKNVKNVKLSFCFTPKDTCPPGFLLDNGKMFSKKGP